jgi:hypothetical protein
MKYFQDKVYIMSQNNPLSYIKTKNSLRKKEKLHTIKRLIVDKIQQDIDIAKLRDKGCIDPELINFVASCCKELCKSKYGIDEKEFVLEILNIVFSGCLTENEQHQIKQQIDFINDNGLVNKVEISFKLKMIIWDWIKRKFL